MKETDHPLSDQPGPALLTLGPSEQDGESAWSEDDGGADDTRAAGYRIAGDLGGGLASVGFIGAALRRTKKIWCTLAAVGLGIGLILCVAYPATKQATAAILVGQPTGLTPGTAVQDDRGLIQSRTVAAAALRSLGLRQNPARFVSEYTTSAATNQIVDVTVKASSAQLAVREANALSSAFVAFQAQLLQSQQQLVLNSMQAQVSQAQLALEALDNRISLLAGEPSSPKQQKNLASLRAQSSHDAAALTTLIQTVIQNQASSEVATTTVVKDTRVLDPAVASSASAAKRLLLYGGGGLLAGLVVGLAIVIVGALTSARLRRRDDVARALGMPVKLSVSQSALPPAGAGSLDAHQDPDVQRVVAHLQSTLSPGRDGPATLAVVPVDDLAIPALCVTALGIAAATQGRHVMLADLCDGAPAARLLGVVGTGIQTVTVGNVHLTVAVPEGYPVAITGPLARSARETAATRRLADACASADVLLTLVSLDPSVGSDHLSGWADRAVPMVTAGRSSAAHVYAVGEMIRLAGLHPVSAVLLGADDTDESLGVVAVPEAPAASAQHVQAETVLVGHASPAAPEPLPGHPAPG